MARAHFADVLIGTSGTGALSLLDGATVHVYDQGTTNHIAQTLYAADSGGTTIANPLTSDANGKVEFWLDTPARVDLVASKTGFSPSTRTVDVEDVPIAVSGTPSVGDTLVYDGTKFVPQAPSYIVFAEVGAALADGLVQSFPFDVAHPAFVRGTWALDTHDDLVVPETGLYRAWFHVTSPLRPVESLVEIQINSDTAQISPGLVDVHQAASVATGFDMRSYSTVFHATAGQSVGQLQMQQLLAAAYASDVEANVTIMLEVLSG